MPSAKKKAELASSTRSHDAPDTFVPDNIVALELGGVSLMTLYRWTNDPDVNFPLPIKMNGRNYRSRRELEAFKKELQQQALEKRKQRPKRLHLKVEAV
jgi:predicted DNA-binding transcriptional regulator AlpA